MIGVHLCRPIYWLLTFVSSPIQTRLRGARRHLVGAGSFACSAAFFVKPTSAAMADFCRSGEDRCTQDCDDSDRFAVPLSITRILLEMRINQILYT